jgi:hypothetical protein
MPVIGVRIQETDRNGFDPFTLPRLNDSFDLRPSDANITPLRRYQIA